MNRRAFLGTLGLAPVVAVTPSIASRGHPPAPPQAVDVDLVGRWGSDIERLAEASNRQAIRVEVRAAIDEMRKIVPSLRFISPERKYRRIQPIDPT